MNTKPRYVVKLLPSGMSRVLDGQVGMTFIVDKFTDTVDNRGQMAHVRDYRYDNKLPDRPFQIWSLGPGDYEIVEGVRMATFFCPVCNRELCGHRDPDTTRRLFMERVRPVAQTPLDLGVARFAADVLLLLAESR